MSGHRIALSSSLHILVIGLYILICQLEASEATNNINGCGQIVNISARSGKMELWPGARVPYLLEGHFREEDRVAFRHAVENIHRHTCILFEPRRGSDEIYLQVRMNFETPPYCGIANTGYYGDHPYAEIRHDCSNVPVFVHELAHVLGFLHEFTRPDRDDFLDYSKCTDPSQIESVENWDVSRGHLFDYASQLQSYCTDPCKGLILHSASVCNNAQGLSLLDADKINFFYQCKGCHRHRWYRVDTLTNEQESELVNFASQEGDLDPVFICRGYIKKEIGVGRYIPAEKSCFLSYGWGTYKAVTKHIQVFALPNGPNRITYTSEGYRLYKYTEVSELSNIFMWAGREGHNDKIFAAIGQITGEDGKNKTVVGKLYDHKRIVLTEFPDTLNGEMNLVTPNYFGVVGCS